MASKGELNIFNFPVLTISMNKDWFGHQR